MTPNGRSNIRNGVYIGDVPYPSSLDNLLVVDDNIIYEARVISLSSGPLGVNTIPSGGSTAILDTTSSFRSGYYAIDLKYNWNENDNGGGTTSVVFGGTSYFAIAIEVDNTTSPYAWSLIQKGNMFVDNLVNGDYHRGGVVNINGSSQIELIWGNASGSIAFGNTSSIDLTLTYLGE